MASARLIHFSSGADPATAVREHNVANSIVLSPDIDEGTGDEMLVVLKRMTENVGGTILPPSGRSGMAV